MHRPVGITIVAWVYWFLGAIFLVFGLIGLITAANLVAGLLPVIVGGLAFASGVGLMKHQPWARMTSFIFSGIMLLFVIMVVISGEDLIIKLIYAGFGMVGVLPGLYLLRPGIAASIATKPEHIQTIAVPQTAGRIALRIVGAVLSLLGMFMLAFGLLVSYSNPTLTDAIMSIIFFGIPGIFFLIPGLLCVYLGRLRRIAAHEKESIDAASPRA
jgi:hypothetical protein